MEYRNQCQKNRIEITKASKFSKIILGVIAGVIVLVILLVSFSGAIRQEYKEKHLDEYYSKLIDEGEKMLVHNAFSQVSVQMEMDAEDHLRLLFMVLWLYRNTKEIDIVAAEIVAFSNSDITEIVGEYCDDGYALRVTMNSGDVYTVWYSTFLQRILKNDSEEIWIAVLGI